MTRDEKTKFEHQKALFDERPEINPPITATELRSFNMVIGPDELILALKIDDRVNYVRVNPDVALNLGLTLIKVVQQQNWSALELDLKIEPPKFQGN